jgi:predicted MFS family arabinose efflux permease
MQLFAEGAERAKAMGVLGFICSCGGSIGVLLGGLLTNALDWHWIFLVNIPVGIGVLTASVRLLPPAGGDSGGAAQLDIAGAVTVTAALMFAIYAIVNGNEVGWLSGQTIGMLAAVAALA